MPEQKTLKRQQSRPKMSEGYGIDPKVVDKMLNWEWASEQMKNSHNYWISTTRPDGRPHTMPVWGIWLEDTLYFGTDPNSRKGRNLAANPAVVAHTESGDNVVIVEGVVEEMRDLALFARIAKLYGEKYPGYEPPLEPVPGQIFFAVKPQLVHAWLESDFVNSATRWHFSEEN